MQVLILYYSRTGNTKRLAEEIARGVREVPDVECVLKKTAEVTKHDLLAAEAIIAGSPDYFGSMASELKEIFDRFVGIRQEMENKVGAAFSTGGDSSGGKETTLISILQAMLIYGMIIVGDPLDATGHYGIACIEEPDAEAAQNAAKLGKRVALLAKKLQS
ncbi:flavodoxin family protein [candidate division KSB3 bacterium]|uniref:Flavodoxin family protein n=1 Tax=candidate division KSB3 bacterium TaxID=2044937 RepID=A0A9D5JU39_9BACT|nr:flavodoxin family protein [candidate division KSB3 bacterium]MBD3324115.1 flavodoxin family protein [candidate division KSB3 bacterium]